MSGAVEQRRIPPVDEEGDEVRVEAQQPELSGPDRLLMLAAFAGPLAWMVQLGFDLPLVNWMCHHMTRWPMHAVTLAALLGTLWGLWVCWSERGGERMRPGTEGEEEQVDAPLGVRRALAWFGVGSGLFFLLLILASDVPGLILEPCR